MDKKSIIGIAVVAVLFLGFAYLNTKEQKKYEQERISDRKIEYYG